MISKAAISGFPGELYAGVCIYPGFHSFFLHGECWIVPGWVHRPLPHAATLASWYFPFSFRIVRSHKPCLNNVIPTSYKNHWSGPLAGIGINVGTKNGRWSITVNMTMCDRVVMGIPAQLLDWKELPLSLDLENWVEKRHSHATLCDSPVANSSCLVKVNLLAQHSTELQTVDVLLHIRILDTVKFVEYFLYDSSHP